MSRLLEVEMLTRSELMQLKNSEVSLYLTRLSNYEKIIKIERDLISACQEVKKYLPFSFD